MRLRVGLGGNAALGKPSEPGSLSNASSQTQMWMGGEDYALGLISPSQLGFCYSQTWRGLAKALTYSLGRLDLHVCIFPTLEEHA